MADDTQSNSARFIYTLVSRQQLQYEQYPLAEDGSPLANSHVCRLNQFTDLYLRREPRSDEKLRYTETEIATILRTILFMYVYRCGPTTSILDIQRHGEVQHPIEKLITARIRRQLTLPTVIALFDSLFGKNFSSVTRRAVTRVFHQYQTSWRYHGCGVQSVAMPSAADYMMLFRFAEPRIAMTCMYTPSVRFLLHNLNDHRIHLQGAVKRL